MTYFKFSVDCVKTSNQMLQKELECLWEAEEILALSVGGQERSDAGTAVVNQATLVGGHVLRLRMSS